MVKIRRKNCFRSGLPETYNTELKRPPQYLTSGRALSPASLAKVVPVKPRGHPRCEMRVLAVRSSRTPSCPRFCFAEGTSAVSFAPGLWGHGKRSLRHPPSAHPSTLLPSSWVMAAPAGRPRERLVELSVRQQLQGTKARPPTACTASKRHLPGTGK